MLFYSVKFQIRNFKTCENVNLLKYCAYCWHKFKLLVVYKIYHLIINYDALLFIRIKQTFVQLPLRSPTTY